MCLPVTFESVFDHLRVVRKASQAASFLAISDPDVNRFSKIVESIFRCPSFKYRSKLVVTTIAQNIQNPKFKKNTVCMFGFCLCFQLSLSRKSPKRFAVLKNN